MANETVPKPTIKIAVIDVHAKVKDGDLQNAHDELFQTYFGKTKESHPAIQIQHHTNAFHVENTNNLFKLPAFHYILLVYRPEEDPSGDALSYMLKNISRFSANTPACIVLDTDTPTKFENKMVRAAQEIKDKTQQETVEIFKKEENMKDHIFDWMEQHSL